MILETELNPDIEVITDESLSRIPFFTDYIRKELFFGISLDENIATVQLIMTNSGEFEGDADYFRGENKIRCKVKLKDIHRIYSKAIQLLTDEEIDFETNLKLQIYLNKTDNYKPDNQLKSLFLRSNVLIQEQILQKEGECFEMIQSLIMSLKDSLTHENWHSWLNQNAPDSRQWVQEFQLAKDFMSKMSIVIATIPNFTKDISIIQKMNVELDSDIKFDLLEEQRKNYYQQLLVLTDSINVLPNIATDESIAYLTTRYRSNLEEVIIRLHMWKDQGFSTKELINKIDNEVFISLGYAFKIMPDRKYILDRIKGGEDIGDVVEALISMLKIETARQYVMDYVGLDNVI